MSEEVAENVVSSNSENYPAFFNSLFVKDFELETGDVPDAMYNSDVNEVACANLICSKRISCAGQE